MKAILKINNSKEAAIYRKDSYWKNPGAALYDKLMESYYSPGNDSKSLSYKDYLKEAYLIAPVNDIKNSPYGVTPYSRSGCKYPHHEIRGDELVVNVNGLKAAYARARQMKVFHGDLKNHILRHIKELDLEDHFNIEGDDLIEENFNWIEAYVFSSESIEDEIEYISESDETSSPEDQNQEVEESLSKQIDRKEKGANGIKRKQLYIEFIKYAKKIHSNNLFGSIFDKNAFDLYTFVPHEMRYFYRLANPLLCVLENSLTFFALSELKKINESNKELDKYLIFAADKSGTVIIFNKQDKKIYDGENKDNKVTCSNVLANSFDEYIENLVGVKILGESYVTDIDNEYGEVELLWNI